MVRPRTIDRERLLDVAEGLISDAGAAALSFGGLAEAAGLPKSSVQSVFHTREEMIEALLARWLRKEQQAFERALPAQPSARESVLGHIDITARESSENSSRLAAVLAALVGADAPDGVMAKWYASRIGDLAADTPSARHLRIAFLAVEGAFFMRHMAGFPMSEALWQEVFEDLRAFVRAQPA